MEIQEIKGIKILSTSPEYSGIKKFLLDSAENTPWSTTGKNVRGVAFNFETKSTYINWASTSEIQERYLQLDTLEDVKFYVSLMKLTSA